MALKSMGSLRMSHDMEIWYRVGRSKMPLGVGLKEEFIEMDLM